jgi:cytochrome c peroxidase
VKTSIKSRSWLRRAILVLLILLVTTSVSAAEPLVDQGRRIFFSETFDGNGRTCGTCHPADNNYTIDPAYIRRLPKDDPLFVAEFTPQLRGLDRSRLLRKLGLVVVNADGFDKPGVLRGVPHLLGLGRSIQVELGSLTPPGRASDLAAATGWSGDGAPGDGSLRGFALGAVKQHLTKSLARVPGRDFRVPTATELDALLAFLLSLGRTGELDLGNGFGVIFTSPLVERGRELFTNEVSGSCAFCHRDATALNEGGANALFDIGVAQRLDAPGRRLDPTIPGDGGFGAAPPIMVAGRPGYGDGRMNTPSLIEAADTAPLFHDNSAATVEDAVRYYTTADFANSPEGQALPEIRLTGDDVVAIAALLRTLNALENIRNANALLREALGKPAAAARPLITLARADTEDAIDVLTRGPAKLYDDAGTRVRASLKLERAAAKAASPATRDTLLAQAIALKEQARDLMVNFDF